MRKSRGLRKHISEISVIALMLLGVFLLFRFTALDYAVGYVTADLNESIFVDVPVEDEVEDELDAAGEVDIIIEFNDEEKARSQGVDSVLKKGFKEENRFANFNGVSGKIDKEALNKIRKNPKVKKIFLDRQLRIDLQDSARIINATNSWGIESKLGNITGKGSVCVIDTGIDYNHPDLAGNYLAGYDYVNDDADPMDDNGHGTHVAGIIAANGSIKGVAPSSKIIAVKVCNSGGSCSASDVTAAIEWCNNNKTAFDIRVITMSLGGGLFASNCDSSFPSIAAAADAAASNNIIVFAASGNSGSTTSISAPACLTNVVAVAGSDKNDALYLNGNRNALVNVIAPAVSIKSTYLGSGSAILTGTSMATPHAAAVANLLQHYSESNGKLLNPSEIKNVLKDNGKMIFDAGSSRSYSRLDAYKSLLSLDKSKPAISIISLGNGSITGKKWKLVNVSSNERLGNAILQWNNLNASMQGSYKIFYRNVTNLSGVNYYNAFGVDNSGNIGSSGLMKLSLESKTPNITLVAPGNGSILDYKKISFSFSATDDIDNQVDCSLSIGNSSDNIILYNSTIVVINKTLSDGLYTWKVECKDSSNNNAVSSFFNLEVDGPPLIANLSPTGVVQGNIAIVNFSTDEASSCRASFSENSSIASMNISFDGSLLHSYSLEGDDKSYTVYAGCSDTSNKTSYSTWQFSLAGTTTTIPESSNAGSGGGSSGGGGGSKSSSLTQPVSQQEVTGEQQPLQISQQAEQTVEEEQQASAPSAEVNQQEAITRPGLAGLMGNVIRGANNQKGFISAGGIAAILLMGYFAYTRYIKRNIK